MRDGPKRGAELDFRERFEGRRRAVAPAVVLVELALPLCSVGGQVIFLKDHGQRGNERRTAFRFVAAARFCNIVSHGEERCIYIVKR